MSWSVGLWKSDASGLGAVELRSFYTGTGTSYEVPSWLLGVGSRLFFAGPDSKLWTSDGTPGGTIQVGDVRISRSEFTRMAGVNGRLFFAGEGGSGDVELWVSDGTSGGTRRVKDIDPSGSSSPGFLTKLGSGVLFIANSGLWRSDGTEAGTILVKDFAIVPLGIYMYPVYGNPYYQLAEADGKLFFDADDGAHGYEIWTSDGSLGGTRLVKDINPSGSSEPIGLTSLGDKLFFATGDATSFVLWKTDGTEAGTSIVKSFAQSNMPTSGGLTKVGDKLYFLARDSSGDKLWKSDGTGGGTAPVASLPAANQPPQYLTGAGGRLFFVATDNAHGRELWASDGTAAGTKVVKDIRVGPNDAAPFGLTDISGTLFFMVWGGNDYELWKSDGTAGGTVRITALGLGNIEPSWEPADFTPAGSRLFFTTGLRMDGLGLWVSDGTAAGTAPVVDSALRKVLDPQDLAGVNGKLLFSRNDDAHGRELWRSDGTVGGTVLVKDINPGPFSSVPSNIHQVCDDGWALFAASGGPGGVELWQTDGTFAHTVQLQDIAPGASSSNPASFVGAGARVYFIADDGATGPELWSLDRGLFQDLVPFNRYVPLSVR